MSVFGGTLTRGAACRRTIRPLRDVDRRRGRAVTSLVLAEDQELGRTARRVVPEVVLMDVRRLVVDGITATALPLR